jgi:hypothetical protein
MGNLRQSMTDEEWDLLATENHLNKEWIKPITIHPSIKNIKLNIFKKILDEFRDWDEMWKHYKTNSDYIKKPKNANEFVEDLSNRYNIEKL